jgi:hypothetical protein
MHSTQVAGFHSNIVVFYEKRLLHMQFQLYDSYIYGVSAYFSCGP